MSLLDNLGTSSINKVNNMNNISNKLNNLKYLAGLLTGKGLNARDLAINMLNQNTNLNNQLKEFLISNGVTEDQLKQLGINI